VERSILFLLTLESFLRPSLVYLNRRIPLDPAELPLEGCFCSLVSAGSGEDAVL